MPDNSEIARVIAEAHRNIEPAICRIIRLVADGDREHDSREPIKLLEVNPDTSPSGILPIAFGADPPRVPFPSVVIEVTEGDLTRFATGVCFCPMAGKLVIRFLQPQLGPSLVP